MIVVTILIGGVAAAAGYIFGTLNADRQHEADKTVMRLKMEHAYRQAGRLGNKIFKQRLMIKKLKAQIPAQPKKSATKPAELAH
jgi:hypothetical protein